VSNPVEPLSAVQERVTRLRRLDACAVSDAFDRLKLSGVVAGVPRQSGAGRIAGVAVTLKLDAGPPPRDPPLLGSPAEPPAPDRPRHLGTAAIEIAGPDNVIVVEQRTGIEAGCWGGLLTLGAKVRGVAGVIADGPVRDIDEARMYDFPIFTRAVTALTARGRVVERSTNTAVTAWSVTVNPGDYVIADASAVIFIAAVDIDRVLEVAESIAAREASMARAILAGVPISKVMGGNYETMLRG
jgi:4-hydroxy-4-methyl-2-oxoglutarate aldolase